MHVAYYGNGTSQSYDDIIRQVNISNCNFTDNIGNGAAMEIIQLSSANRAVSLFHTLIKSCKFDCNYQLMNYHGPVLNLISIEVTISNSAFTGSNTSAIGLRNTYLKFFGDILFANNTALAGAAIKLCDVSLIFGQNGTNIIFSNNRARKGGAIYIQQECIDNTFLCFFQPTSPKGAIVGDVSKRMNLNH